MQVFISHSSQDKPFARRLRDELQKCGLRVWLDEAEIRVGQSIPEKIGRAVESSDIFCIFISRASCNSPWVARELNAFMPRMIDKGGVVLPCRLDDALSPPLLADIKYADFSESFEKGLTDLLAGFGVKEEIDKYRALEEGRNTLIKSLTSSELIFFVHKFQRSIYYFIGNFTEEPAPWTVLRKLKSLGVVEETSDKYEVIFTLTSWGEKLLEAVSSMVPEEALAELDRTEGHRDPRRIRRKRPDSKA